MELVIKFHLQGSCRRHFFPPFSSANENLRWRQKAAHSNSNGQKILGSYRFSYQGANILSSRRRYYNTKIASNKIRRVIKFRVDRDPSKSYKNGWTAYKIHPSAKHFLYSQRYSQTAQFTKPRAGTVLGSWGSVPSHSRSSHSRLRTTPME